MKKIIALFLAGIISIFVGVTGASPSVAQGSDKVFVCKYVGTPGVDERLQTGQNPISVSVNSIPDYHGVGSYFADAHGRSYVLAEDVGQPEPDASECPTDENPTPPTVTETVTLPPVTETVTQPPVTETVTLPPVTDTVTLPPVTETATVTLPPVTETVGATETVTLPPVTETVNSTATATATVTKTTTVVLDEPSDTPTTKPGKHQQNLPNTGTGVNLFLIALGVLALVAGITLLAGRVDKGEHT